jgi:tRNA threonylcarbamoyl adenosine modification protein YjeE
MVKQDLVFVADITDWADMKRAAERMAARFRQGDLIGLHGDVGAGKSTLVAEMARAWGVEEPVTSPTYTLYKIYTPPAWTFPLIHLDAYRLEPESERPWDYKDWRKGLVLVEWPERSGIPTTEFTYDIFLEEDQTQGTRLCRLISRMNS